MANPIDIRNFIDVSTGIQAVPASRRLFNTCLFIYKGAKQSGITNRVNYYTSVEDVSSAYGSNHIATKAATIYFGGGVKVTPAGLYIANIDSSTTKEMASSDVTVSATEITYAGSGDAWTLLTTNATANKLTYATLSTSDTSVDCYLFISDSSAKKVKAYESATAFTEGTSMDLTDLAGLTVTITLYADALTDALSELMGNSDFYMIVPDVQAESTDVAFTVNETKTIMSAIESSAKVTHFGFIPDLSSAAAYSNKTTDVTSLSIYGYLRSLKKSACIVSDSTKREEFHALAAASYFAGVNFTTARPMGTLAWKVISGISASTFSAGGSVSADMAWKNITSKYANAYITMGETGRSNFQTGLNCAGSDIGDVISGDYLNYTITYNIYDLLVSIDRLPMTVGGKASLNSVISNAFENLYISGVIAQGTSIDGETFGGHGYNISITVPTGTARAQGLWDNIICTALLAGSCKKVVIANTLKL